MKILPILCAGLFAMISNASSQPLKDVSIATASNGFSTFPPVIAKELGLFEKHGLNAKIVVMDSGTSATTALLSRSTDAAAIGTANLVAALAAGQKPVVISNLSVGSTPTLILSKQVVEKLKISQTSPPIERLKALDGLLIASGSATSMNTV